MKVNVLRITCQGPGELTAYDGEAIRTLEQRRIPS